MKMKNGRGGRTGKRATIKDIAALSGVSTAAVSFALNGTGSVGEEVRQRVLAAAKALDYQRNHSAISMRTGQSHTIGLVLPDLCNPYFPELAQAVEDAARRAGYAVLLADSGNGRDERESLERLVRHGVDGICWCPDTVVDRETIRTLSTPIVLVDRPLPGFDVAHSDYEMGGRLLVEHLAKAHHRRIGLLAGRQDVPGAAERRNGFVDALVPELTLVWEARTAHSLDLDAEAAAQLGRRDVDVIVCANDVIAIAAIRLLKQQGLEVPRDVAVVGFDDIPWSTIVTPNLTTIRQRVTEIGHKGVELLLRRFADPAGPFLTVALGVELVVRESSP